MSLVQTLLALICVAAISTGQLLFKKAGLQIQEIGTWMSWSIFVTVAVAAIIYALATLLWIDLLRSVDLNKAYVFMALSFVFVPIASHFIYHEAVTLGYMVGTALVITGLIVAVRFG